MNSYLDWEAAIAACRMLAVVRGDVFPRENEPIDIVLLAAIMRCR